MAQQTALIVGASRGLGLGLAREYARRGWRVVGTVRDEAGEQALRAAGDIDVRRLDVADYAAIDAFKVDGDLDLLFLNAGIGSAVDFMDADSAESARVIHINAVAPARLARLLLETVRPETGVIAFMSSRMGSIAQDTEGGWEAYRASKSAQNAFAAALAAKQAKALTVLSLEPGWVKTDLGGPDATSSVEESVPALVDIVERCRGAGGHRFLDIEGREVAW